MRRTRLFVGLALLVLGIAVALPGSPVSVAGAADIEQMIASAKTPADHEAIAAYYEGQAKEARQKAEEHRKMGAVYKKEGGAFLHKTHFDEHCAALIRNFTSEAKEYEALAAAHRQLAKPAK